MFGNRRRRAASNPPLDGSNASFSATTAAAQAFLKNASSNASLSSAAAAAALRSRPMTPTSVADVQTKRTLRRANSNSSTGSSVAASLRAPPGSQLERRGSSGSMTERTFRDPSPARSPARSQPVPSSADAPPVPAIPKNMQQTAPTIPLKSHRRAASLEAPPMRIASPPPNMASGRGSSLGPTGTTQSPKRTGPRASGLSSVQELIGVDRPASRGSVHSINFSYPTGSRPTSPVAQRRLTSPAPQRQNLARIVSPTNQNLIYDPNTRSFLPEAQILAIEQRYTDAANRPVKKKKKVVSAAGTHLSDGTVGGRPRGTAIDAMEAAASSSAPKPEHQPVAAPTPPSFAQTVPPAAPELGVATTPTRRKKKRVVLSESENERGSYAQDSSETDSDVSTQPQVFNTRAGAMLAKKPSIVREDQEREEEEDDTPGRRKATETLTKLDTSPAATRQISPSPLPRSLAGRGHGRGQARTSAAFAEGRQHARSASQPPLSPTEPPTAEAVGLVTRDSVRGGRVESVSPARTAHFATTPDNLVVKHQPPARSISPRKSALKHSNSPRGPSPVEGHAVDPNGSEASGSVVGSEELVVPKKKANRVSFDETNVVVGEAATIASTDSPIVSSPQAKRPWYSIGRGKKKETEAAMADEDDEIMKPRPALPSFGSVRERKAAKEVEERPLVKPAEPVEEKLPHASPHIFTLPTGEIIEYPLGQSNDHVVGAVLAEDATSKNEANISKSREPLPPEVTTVEGSGYHSDTESSVCSLDNSKSDIGVARGNSVKHGPADGHVDRALANHDGVHGDEHTNGKSIIDELDKDQAPTPKVNDVVPEIAIVQATPTIAESISKKEWPDMPGAWGSSDTTDDTEIFEPPAVQPTTAFPSAAELTAVVSTPTAAQVAEPEVPIHTTPAIIEEPEESDASIYSDAAEELTDNEGDGFMSLDAVVESPVIHAKTPGLAITTPPDSPITKLTKEKAYKKSQLTRKDSEPDMNAGWDKVQEYWSTLSADKKRQLEMEAREGEDSDTEVEEEPTTKPRKKMAVQSELVIFPAQPQPAPISERSYMIQPGARAGPNGNPPMRSSMRPETANTTEEPHIRKSMRGPGSMRSSLRGSSETVKSKGPGAMRSSMRGSSASIEPKGSLQKKRRPLSHPPSEVKADPATVNRHARNLSAASAAAAGSAAQRDMAPKPILRRKSSGDSDSSFKRAKPTSNEIPTSRQSMRMSSEQEQPGRAQSPTRSSRFSLRSLSPTGSTFRRPFNSAAAPVSSTPTHMRNSMRSVARDAPTLRNSTSRGSGRLGSAKPSKQKSHPNKSRFADSSDEDEDKPAFRSRFGDSSDEDEPTPAPLPRTMLSSAPVRGIPKRSGAQDGDSSDLPDSDEEKPGSSALKLGKKRAQNGTAPVSNQGATLASGSLRRSGSGRETISSPTTATAPARPSHSRSGGFMSILRRKKPDPASKVRKSDAESPARRDTPLERSKMDLANLRAERPPERPGSPKLQKRRTISRENSGAWPLPPPTRVLGGDDGRPFSADNGNGVVGSHKEVNGDARPDLGTRRFTATGLADVDINGITDSPGRKKKKFGKLRRMFRLDD